MNQKYLILFFIIYSIFTMTMTIAYIVLDAMNSLVFYGYQLILFFIFVMNMICLLFYIFLYQNLFKGLTFPHIKEELEICTYLCILIHVLNALFCGLFNIHLLVYIVTSNKFDNFGGQSKVLLIFHFSIIFPAYIFISLITINPLLRIGQVINKLC